MLPNWKLERIKSLHDEVKDVHPVLVELFRKLPNIAHVNYTQGNRESGADFVLVKKDEVLLDEDYVGVIVKSTQIKQDHDDVNRQIRECELPRPIHGGAKQIVLSEIWVITSKTITRNAQDFILHEHKSKKVKFFDAEKLVGLIDRFYSEYWEIGNLKLNKYISAQKENIQRSEGQHSLLPNGVARFQFQSKIESEPRSDNRKFSRKKSRASTLLEEIKKNKFIFLEGGMGSGKSELLRATAKDFCDVNTIEELDYVPYLTTYRELKAGGLSASEIVSNIELELGDLKKTIIFFIDSFDETAESISSKAEYVCEFANGLSIIDNVKLVVASRSIQEEKVVEKLERYFDRYSISQLSYGVIISIVEQLCSDRKVSDKFRDDLQNSHLMKALPKTPLSAILLGRLLAENVKELPSTLPELYAKYTDLVLGRWDLNKGNGSEKEYETIQRITALVAAYMLDNDLEFLGVNELTQIFKEYLGQRRTGQNVDSLVEAFLGRHEIIGVNDSEDVIFFKHKTFKEFFYAMMLFQKKGIEAPINKPFDLYWKGTEYFYLGLVKDAPARIESLSQMVPEDDLELLIKVSSMAEFMLAAYQTPYNQIEVALSYIFKDLARLYVDVAFNSKDSWLQNLPELQLLCVMTVTLRKAYGYEFFLPALLEAKLQAEIDGGLSVDHRNIEIFFIDAVLASLGDENAFASLGGEFENSLGWAVRVGIKCAAEDAGLVNAVTKKISKRIMKATKGNHGFLSYLREVQEVPIIKRKSIIH